MSAYVAPGFVARLSAFYGAIFFVIGVQAPFLPLWFDWKGLGPREIAVVMALPLLLRLVVTPTVAYLADRADAHRSAILAMAWSGFCALVALAFAEGFLAILLATLAFTLLWSTVIPLTEVIAMRGVRRAGLDYGRMRLWGSLTFIAASFLGGIAVERSGPAAALWLLIAGGLATALVAHAMPATAGETRSNDARVTAPRTGARDILALLARPELALFMVAAGSVQASHAVFYTFGVIHWRSVGISTTWCGILWAVGVVTEIALFLGSKRAVARFGPIGLLALGGTAGVLRWTVTAFDPPLAGLLAVQVLHGLTFGATHLGAVHYISRTFPEGRQGTVQALHSSVTAGIAMAGATALAGVLYAGYGAASYLAMAAFALVGQIACVLLARQAKYGHNPGASTDNPHRG
jgi:PPP family 3-phenylpropionic acid transporter